VTQRGRTKVMRPLDWTFPPAAVERELLHVPAAFPAGDRPPLLFVHGMNHGAWCWREHWMPAAAERGWESYAVSLRGHGASGGHDARHRWKFRDYEHDVMQAIIELPAPPVIVAHSMGAQVVRRVLDRYVPPAAVLLAPPGGTSGLGVMVRFARRQPTAFTRALLGQPIVLAAEDLFGPEMDPVAGRRYANRMTPEAPLAQYELMLRPHPRNCRTPVLVLGGSEDALVSVPDMVRAARIYGTQPHVFRGMGHDLMLEPRWQQPLDFLLDWLEKTLPGPR
jgi:pimeloyl-ACP methyl ester carboxylesterase